MTTDTHPDPLLALSPLLPCPFCGSPASLWGEVRSIYPHVVCDSEACKCCGPALYSAEAAIEAWNTRTANARGDGDTHRLDFMLLYGFSVKRMVDTGGYMLLHEEYPFDGGEFETPREAIDDAMRSVLTPPTPGSEVQS